MTTISNNKIQVLEENFRNAETSLTFREWIEQEAQNDPDFFRFLFDEDLEGDFDSSLSEEQRDAFQEFLSEVE